MATWISTESLPITGATSPVTSAQMVCVRFFDEPREEALNRGFFPDCDSLIWDQNPIFGNGRIIEYMIQD